MASPQNPPRSPRAQLVTRIGDQRRAGVADESYRFARRQIGQQRGRSRAALCSDRRAGLVMAKWASSVGCGACPRNRSHRPAPAPQATQGDIGEVADRRGDHMRPAAATRLELATTSAARSATPACDSRNSAPAPHPALIRFCAARDPYAAPAGDLPAEINGALAHLLWRCLRRRGTTAKDLPAGGAMVRQASDPVAAGHERAAGGCFVD